MKAFRRATTVALLALMSLAVFAVLTAVDRHDPAYLQRSVSVLMSLVIVACILVALPTGET